MLRPPRCVKRLIVGRAGDNWMIEKQWLVTGFFTLISKVVSSLEVRGLRGCRLVVRSPVRVWTPILPHALWPERTP